MGYWGVLLSVLEDDAENGDDAEDVSHGTVVGNANDVRNAFEC